MSILRELLPIAGLALLASGVTLAEAQTAPARQVPGAAPATAAAAEKPVILVDLGNGQTFFRTEPGRETPIRVMYRNMAGYLGAELRVTTEPLSKETLQGARTLLLFAPLEQVETAEVQAVVEFVQQGGGLLVGTATMPGIAKMTPIALQPARRIAALTAHARTSGFTTSDSTLDGPP